jgi:DNA polymerase
MKNLYNALLLKHLYQLKQIGYRYTDIPISKYDESNLQLPSNMRDLRREAIECHLCDLSRSRNLVVFGEGNENADILFIGEAPGGAENDIGKPFIGRTGELLTNMIERVLLISRSDVYITNIVKCHPTDNRIPTPTEAHTCLPFLLKQIESIDPKIIVTLGATAYHYLTGDDSDILKVRGTVQRLDRYSIVPTLHPSYLLRNPSTKRDVFNDMRLVKSLML